MCPNETKTSMFVQARPIFQPQMSHDNYSILARNKNTSY